MTKTEPNWLFFKTNRFSGFFFNIIFLLFLCKNVFVPTTKSYDVVILRSSSSSSSSTTK